RIVDAPNETAIETTVDVSEMMGSEIYLHVNASGKDVVVRVPTTDLPAEYRAGIPYGTKEYFTFPADLVHLFDAETEKNLLD
ncbi:MAG: ABC transporter ATP-binding protein, partial [Clostridia bacterium]|nr:ABC transporter ATP-binding protein [Clostridia bacterium]